MKDSIINKKYISQKDEKYAILDRKIIIFILIW